MPAYHYQALDARGNTVSGVIDGDADRQVRASLRERGLTPLEVEPVAEKRRSPLLQWNLRPGIRSADLAILTRQFSTLVQAGSDLTSAERQALPVLAEDMARRITGMLVDGTW